ncbi:tetratricopeptide repeat protein [Deefgea sp. CFH1-16]|uniref:tetratricopeptide repeat protein n=1 Tax=Deefgea sp. CFH1-16 TaxID=2675457 RepID=UPI0015F54E24|nr:tetratricopeptide repeat protein [Deefgea sp. CFH1-16]MBM5575403.1 tetratricopeptide repeat protein [Deefgea sp. CFH1-16]
MSKNKKRLSKVAAVLTERAVPNNIIQRLASIVALANYYQLELEIRKQLLHYPSSAILFKMLALSLNLQGKDALDPALRAAELAPNDPQVFNNLGNAYIRLGLYPEAIAAFFLMRCALSRMIQRLTLT